MRKREKSERERKLMTRNEEKSLRNHRCRSMSLNSQLHDFQFLSRSPHRIFSPLSILASLLTPKRPRITPSDSAINEPADMGYFYLDPAYDELAAEEEKDKEINSKARFARAPFLSFFSSSFIHCRYSPEAFSYVSTQIRRYFLPYSLMTHSFSEVSIRFKQ